MHHLAACEKTVLSAKADIGEKITTPKSIPCRRIAR